MDAARSGGDRCWTTSGLYGEVDRSPALAPLGRTLLRLSGRWAILLDGPPSLRAALACPCPPLPPAAGLLPHRPKPRPVTPARYNPEYLARPHIVALNKLDLPLQRGGQPAFDEARKRVARQIAASAAAATAQTAPPIAVVPLSGLRGKGIRIMKEAIARALAASEQS